MDNGNVKLRRRAIKIARLRAQTIQEEKGFEKDLRDLLLVHGSAAKLSKDLQIDPARISEVVNGHRKVSELIIQKLVALEA